MKMKTFSDALKHNNLAVFEVKHNDKGLTLNTCKVMSAIDISSSLMQITYCYPEVLVHLALNESSALTLRALKGDHQLFFTHVVKKSVSTCGMLSTNIKGAIKTYENMALKKWFSTLDKNDIFYTLCLKTNKITENIIDKKTCSYSNVIIYYHTNDEVSEKGTVYVSVNDTYRPSFKRPYMATNFYVSKEDAVRDVKKIIERLHNIRKKPSYTKSDKKVVTLKEVKKK